MVFTDIPVRLNKNYVEFAQETKLRMLISFKLLSDNISKGVSLIQFNRKNIAKAINNAKK